MIIAVLLFSISVFLAVSYALTLLLPSFSKEKRYAQLALVVTKSDSELKRLRQGKITNYFAFRLYPIANKFIKVDRLVGKKLRHMYSMLGKDETFEEMLAIKLVKSTIAALPILVLPILTKESLFFFLLPIMILVLYVKDISDIKREFELMQLELSKDLPQLIDKMMIALETGKPFITVFKSLEQTSSSQRMKTLLKRLNGNMLNMEPTRAIELFAKDTTIPVMVQFASAVKIGINSGYEEAKVYFDDLIDEILNLRRTALEQLTKSKPGKMKLLYMLLTVHALAAVVLVFYEMMKSAGSIF